MAVSNQTGSPSEGEFFLQQWPKVCAFTKSRNREKEGMLFVLSRASPWLLATQEPSWDKYDFYLLAILNALLPRNSSTVFGNL